MKKKNSVSGDNVEESSVQDDDAPSINSARGDSPSDGSVETVDEDDDQVIEQEPQQMDEESLVEDQRPPAVRKLDSNLGGFWKDSMVGSVIHEHCRDVFILGHNVCGTRV